jgi:vacuolar protein sorting-associated protein 13A/C
VYFDTDTGSLDKGPEDRAGTLNALKQMVSLLASLVISADDQLAGSPAHQHILRPVTGEARVRTCLKWMRTS